MQAKELPLFELYTRLQEAGFPLGLKEYTQLLKALQGGFGLPDREALSRLCCALWVKNEEEEHIFNYHFDEIIGVKNTSHKDIAEISAQKSALRQELISTQKITVETNRRLSIGTCILYGVFLAILVGLGLLLLGNQEELSSPPLTSEQERAIEDNSEDIAIESKISNIFLLIFLGSTTVSWLLIRQITVAEITPPTEDPNDTITRTTVSKTEIFTTGNDEIQLAKTLRKTSEEKRGIPKIKVIGQDEYFPLTRRQMKQGWRYLRQNSREGPKTEFDIDSTVSQIAEQGLFLRPIMRPARKNRIDLVFLIDQDGSMKPLQSLTNRLVETATRAGRLGSASTYYFHNCPESYVYHDPMMQEPELFLKFLNGRLSSSTSVVVIISDAGAARGGLNLTRKDKTKAFIEQITKHARYAVWINPVPRNRWKLTTAGEVAKLIPMFETNRAEFQSAVDVLRGRLKLSLENLEATL